MLVVNYILLKLVLFMTLVKEQRKSTALFSHNTCLHHISTCLDIYIFLHHMSLQPLCDSIFPNCFWKICHYILLLFCSFYVLLCIFTVGLERFFWRVPLLILFQKFLYCRPLYYSGCKHVFQVCPFIIFICSPAIMLEHRLPRFEYNDGAFH